MKALAMRAELRNSLTEKLPLLELINPREQLWTLLGVLIAGIVFGTIAVQVFGVKLWVASAAVLAAMLLPAMVKWREDYRRFGLTATVLGVLIALQGFHTVEHLAQWFQYHILRWPTFVSSGLISALNAEWVHFVWNWGFLAVAIYLALAGVRNWWAWALLVWATAHTLEHTYMMWRYQQTLAELTALGATGVSPQGLPGFFGRDGWLATADVTQGTFLCRLPGFTTAPRLDVHFWWNVGEIALLLPAANVYMAERFGRRATPPRGSDEDLLTKLLAPAQPSA